LEEATVLALEPVSFDLALALDNTLLQSDKPLIHVLRREVLGLLTDLYTRFVKPDAITSASNLLKVKYSERKYQKSRDAQAIIK
jgi:hypothetical protein